MHYSSIAILVTLGAIVEALPVIQTQQASCDIASCAFALAKGGEACSNAVGRTIPMNALTAAVLRTATCVKDALTVNAPLACKACHDDLNGAAKQLRLCLNGATDDDCTGKLGSEHTQALERRDVEEPLPSSASPAQPPRHVANLIYTDSPLLAQAGSLAQPRIVARERTKFPPYIKTNLFGTKPKIRTKFDQGIFAPNRVGQPRPAFDVPVSPSTAAPPPLPAAAPVKAPSRNPFSGIKFSNPFSRTMH